MPAIRLRWQVTYLLSAICYLLLLLICVGCRANDTSWERIQQAGVLRVGLDPTYPPFEEAIDEEVWGLDVDLARAIAQELGIEVSFSYFGYDGLYDALATKQVDMLISALVIQPERTRDFAYSQPYFNAGQLLVVPASNQPLQSVEQLSNEVVSVELGTQGHLVALDQQKHHPNLQIITYNDVNSALASLQSGEAEVAIVDSVSGRLYAGTETSVKWLPTFAQDEPYAMVTRAEDKQLLAQLNEGLKRLENAGTLQQIISKWLDQ